MCSCGLPVEPCKSAPQAFLGVDADDCLEPIRVELVPCDDDGAERKREVAILGRRELGRRQSATALNPANASSAPTTPAILGRSRSIAPPGIPASGPTIAAEFPKAKER